MKDTVGKYLASWRRRTVFPYISGRLLDIGCGTNELVRCYEGIGIGVDVFPWRDVDVIIQDDGAFDTVTVIAALNHIPNSQEVLVEAFRVLVNGGTLLITMLPPLISGIWHKIREPWDADQKEECKREMSTVCLIGKFLDWFKTRVFR